jgi:hypothetical protein
MCSQHVAGDPGGRVSSLGDGCKTCPTPFDSEWLLIYGPPRVAATVDQAERAAAAPPKWRNRTPVRALDKTPAGSAGCNVFAGDYCGSARKGRARRPANDVSSCDILRGCPTRRTAMMSSRRPMAARRRPSARRAQAQCVQDKGMREMRRKASRARSFLMEALGLPLGNVNLALNLGSRAGFTLQPRCRIQGDVIPSEAILL